MTERRDSNGRARIGVVMLLPSCNLTCPFCITEDGLRSLGYEEAVALIDRFEREGVRNVVLGGGEPTLWPHDVFRLAAVAKERGMFVQLGTNGVRLPEDFEEHPAVDRYVLPLEAADPEIHDRMRPGRGSHHALVLDRLETLRAAGKSTTISTIVLRWNAGEIPRIAEILRRLDPAGTWINSWHLYQFLPRGRGGAVHAPDLSLDPDTYRSICAAAKASGLPFPVYMRPNMYRARSVDFAGREKEG
jgi:MoaA/NifB/PqqE/SkfB family radical SAM enzyme